VRVIVDRRSKHLRDCRFLSNVLLLRLGYNIFFRRIRLTAQAVSQPSLSMRLTGICDYRRGRYVGFLTIPPEPLKVRPQVKHCKNGFCEIFRMSLTKRYVCISKFWENHVSLFYCPFWVIFKKNSSRLRFSFSEGCFSFDCLQGLYLLPNHQYQKKSLTNTKKVVR